MGPVLTHVGPVLALTPHLMGRATAGQVDHRGRAGGVREQLLPSSPTAISSVSKAALCHFAFYSKEQIRRREAAGREMHLGASALKDLFENRVAQ
ncbi:hypothetical protein P7K49_003263, partial [Saguinus oedipus]